MPAIQIDGLDHLIAKFGKMRAIAYLEEPMHWSVNRILQDIRPYPPAIPGSKYIRGWGYAGGPRTSEDLGNRWTTRVTRTGAKLEGRVGNNASYAPYVQHDARFPHPHQARIHQRRWQTDAQVLEQRAAAIRRAFAARIRQVLNA